MSYLFLASLGARVSFIVAATQELVSTPSCINKTAIQAWLGVFLISKNYFYFLGRSPNSLNVGIGIYTIFMVDSLAKLENCNFDKKNR
jgi:hypothetical protein